MKLVQDHQLMKSVKDGNIKDLGQLFERHSKSLYNYFQFQIKDRLKSEDLVQNVFFNILKYRHTYKESHNFKVWMYAIARNETVNYLKNKKIFTDDIDPDQIANNDNNPENNLKHKRDINYLEAALTKISPDKKELIILSRIDGLHYEQIAEIVGCTVGAVKVRMYRAIKELTEYYFEITGESHNEV